MGERLCKHGRMIALMLALAGCASAAPAPLSRDAEGELASGARLRGIGDGADGAEAQPVALDGTLEAYVAHALRHHPALRAQHTRWISARASTRAASAWPDPRITYGVMIMADHPELRAENQRVALEQGIPWRGLLAARAQQAARGADAQRAMALASALAVRREVAQAYWSRWLLDERARLMRLQLIQLDTLEAAVAARLELGQASLSQLQRVALDRARLQDQLEQVDAQARQAQTRFVAALGLDAPRALPLTQSPEVAPELLAMSDEAIVEALARHPELEALRAQRHGADASARAAALSGYPQVMVGAEYIGNSAMQMADGRVMGGPMIMGMISLTLPVWRDASAGREDAARARALATTYDAALTRQRLQAEALTSAQALRDAARRAARYDASLLPQSEALLEASLGAYESGRGDLMDALSAQREALAARMQRAEIAAQLATEAARLESLVLDLAPWASGEPHE